jgi:hypothetical protein
MYTFCKLRPPPLRLETHRGTPAVLLAPSASALAAFGSLRYTVRHMRLWDPAPAGSPRLPLVCPADGHNTPLRPSSWLSHPKVPNSNLLGRTSRRCSVLVPSHPLSCSRTHRLVGLSYKRWSYSHTGPSAACAGSSCRPPGLASCKAPQRQPLE